MLGTFIVTPTALLLFEAYLLFCFFPPPISHQTSLLASFF